MGWHSFLNIYSKEEKNYSRKKLMKRGFSCAGRQRSILSKRPSSCLLVKLISHDVTYSSVHICDLFPVYVKKTTNDKYVYVRTCVCVFARLRFFHAVRKQRLRWKGKKRPSLGKILKKISVARKKKRKKNNRARCRSLLLFRCHDARPWIGYYGSTVHRFIGFLLARTMHACPNVETETCLRHIARHITRTSFLFFFPWNNRFFSFDSSEMTSCIVVEREREGKRFVNWMEISLFRKFLLELSSYYIVMHGIFKGGGRQWSMMNQTNILKVS